MNVCCCLHGSCLKQYKHCIKDLLRAITATRIKGGPIAKIAVRREIGLFSQIHCHFTTPNCLTQGWLGEIQSAPLQPDLTASTQTNNLLTHTTHSTQQPCAARLPTLDSAQSAFYTSTHSTNRRLKLADAPPLDQSFTARHLT